MASKSLASTALLLSLNLVFFTLVSSQSLPPPTTPAPTPPGGCPNLGVCVNLLEDLVKIVIGRPPNRECCGLIPGVLDVQATVCICTAIRVRALSLGIDLDAALNLILNNCRRTPPPGFRCPLA